MQEINKLFKEIPIEELLTSTEMKNAIHDFKIANPGFSVTIHSDVINQRAQIIISSGK